MTNEQIKLIDKTLSVVGYLCITGVFSILGFGVVVGVFFDENIGNYYESFFDPSNGGVIFYPLLIIGIILLWIRSFLRAGINK